MKAKKITAKRTFVVRLERGDEVLGKLGEFCNSNVVESCMVYGIGALSHAKIFSVQDSEKFAVHEQTIEKPMELISALGNITRNEAGKPLVHLHVCLGLPDHTTIGGHLLEGTISYTGEFFIIETEKIIKSKQGEELLLMKI